MGRTTIKDVARISGLSVTTVSQVLNKRKSFSEETVKKVMETVQQTGYVPDRNARQLRGPRRRQIAVVIPELSNPWFGSLMTELENSLDKQQEEVDLFLQTSRKTGVNQTVKDLIARGADGLIIADSVSNYTDINEALKTSNIPYVFLDRAKNQQEYHSILVDDLLGGALAAKHLISLGHFHVAIIVSDQDMHNLNLRQKGFIDKWRETNKTDPQIIKTSLDKRGGIRAADLLNEHVTGVFALNDEMAIGLMHGLHNKGINVPTDISVIGYDGISEDEFTIPALTTIRQPMVKMSDEAISLLFYQLNQKVNDSVHSILIPKLIIRESTAQVKQD